MVRQTVIGPDPSYEGAALAKRAAFMAEQVEIRIIGLRGRKNA
jgi:hypothetical protein